MNKNSTGDVMLWLATGLIALSCIFASVLVIVTEHNDATFLWEQGCADTPHLNCPEKPWCSESLDVNLVS